MRTLIILICGFLLLLAFIGVARITRSGDRKAMAMSALFFLPVWLLATGYNLWIGVSEAGLTEVGSAEVGFCEIGSAQFGSAEVGFVDEG